MLSSLFPATLLCAPIMASPPPHTQTLGPSMSCQTDTRMGCGFFGWTGLGAGARDTRQKRDLAKRNAKENRMERALVINGSNCEWTISTCFRH
ncbi:hypothetical protein DMENIID0001_066550 [Sergentomyia squamirostris]